jgi:putative transposase
MPRTARATVAGYCYHVLNRANNKARIFHDDADYQSFASLIAEAQQRIPLALFAACLMPNHVHLVLRPDHDDDLARWMHWLFCSHVGRHRKRYATNGRIWQGRFKSFVMQQDHHFLTVLRYVERNALAAELVQRAEDWRWGSLRWRGQRQAPVEVHPSPVPLPSYWIDYVNQPQTAAEVAELQTCVNRDRPFGAAEWVVKTAQSLGMESSIALRGRPKKNRPERPVPFSW